jgi:sterol desaturase/sphingolipid hydroxylase (fatty acid hydroxylase superfamily)
MLNLIMKDKLPSAFYNQFIPNLNLLVFCILLTHKTYSPILVSASLFILYFYSYFVHRLLHSLPSIFNFHTNLHHNKLLNSNKIQQISNLFLELVTNISFFVIFYYVQKILFNSCIPDIVIFYYGFIYTSIHIINYSIIHTSQSHVLHHTTSEQLYTKCCNYGPDLADHIFNTNYNNEIENYNHIIPNSILSFLITYYIYKPKLF